MVSDHRPLWAEFEVSVDDDLNQRDTFSKAYKNKKQNIRTVFIE